MVLCHKVQLQGIELSLQHIGFKFLIVINSSKLRNYTSKKTEMILWHESKIF